MSALNSAYQLVCSQCDKNYEAYHQKSTYCSGACRSRAFRRRKKAVKKIMEISGSKSTSMDTAHYNQAKELSCISRSARAKITMIQYTYGGKPAEAALDAVMQALRDVHAI